MQGGVLVAKKERGGFGLATFATGIVYGLQVRTSWCGFVRVRHVFALYDGGGGSASDGAGYNKACMCIGRLKPLPVPDPHPPPARLPCNPRSPTPCL